MEIDIQYNGLFCADSTLAEIVKLGRSTRLLWSGESFFNVTRIFFPIVKSGNHWTLLVGFPFNFIKVVC